MRWLESVLQVQSLVSVRGAESLLQHFPFDSEAEHIHSQEISSYHLNLIEYI